MSVRFCSFPRRLLIVLLFSVAGSPALAAHHLAIPGTGDSQQLFRVLAEDYQKIYPDEVVDIPESTGSGGGIKAVANGLAELGRVARPIKKRERRYKLNYREFALSPIVFFVNHSVKGVDNLTAAQVLGIFKGEIRDWSELGGRPGIIYLVNREDGDSARRVLERGVPGLADLADPIGKVFYTTPEAVQAVLQNDNTMGFAALGMVNKPGIRVLGYEGNEVEDTARMKDYPLMVHLGLVWRGKLGASAQKFFDYLFSERAAALMKKNGALPLFK